MAAAVAIRADQSAPLVASDWQVDEESAENVRTKDEPINSLALGAPPHNYTPPPSASEFNEERKCARRWPLSPFDFRQEKSFSRQVPSNLAPAKPAPPLPHLVI